MANMLDKRDRSLKPLPHGVAVDNIQAYKWVRPRSPGVFQQIHKTLLNLDDRYQRDQVNPRKAVEIARNWDWSLFGTLRVARREDGTLWAFDGGHRIRAAFYRSDITDLPCMVFEMEDVADEARSFIAGAKMSSMINSLDTFRAATMAKEPNAIKTAEILESIGLKAVKRAERAGHVRGVAILQRAVREDPEKAKRVLEVCTIMAGDKPVRTEVFGGLFRLVRHLNGQDVLETYSSELGNLSQEEGERAIRQLRAELGRGGDVVAAKAMMNLLNKGKKTRKLKW